MDKSIVIIGLGAIIIGIGFGIGELIEPQRDMFFMSSFVWTIGCIATILGLSKLADDPVPNRS